LYVATPSKQNRSISFSNTKPEFHQANVEIQPYLNSEGEVAPLPFQTKGTPVVGVGFLFTRKDRTGPAPAPIASGSRSRQPTGESRWAPIPTDPTTPPTLHTLGSGQASMGDWWACRHGQGDRPDSTTTSAIAMLLLLRRAFPVPSSFRKLRLLHHEIKGIAGMLL
jgi:hypothetical protein